MKRPWVVKLSTASQQRAKSIAAGEFERTGKPKTLVDVVEDAVELAADVQAGRKQLRNEEAEARSLDLLSSSVQAMIRLARSGDLSNDELFAELDRLFDAWPVPSSYDLALAREGTQRSEPPTPIPENVGRAALDREVRKARKERSE